MRFLVPKGQRLDGRADWLRKIEPSVAIDRETPDNGAPMPDDRQSGRRGFGRSLKAVEPIDRTISAFGSRRSASDFAVPCRLQKDQRASPSAGLTR